jgi:hypothetical protein
MNVEVINLAFITRCVSAVISKYLKIITMAKVKLNFPLTNSLGDHSLYQMHGVDKTILRSKGGPTADQYNTLPQFETTRGNCTEFGGASKMAGNIRRALYAVKHLADFNFKSALLTIAQDIQTYDVLNFAGKRAITLSRYQAMIKGFNLNKENVFDAVVNASPAFSITRNELKANLQFPDLYPGSNFANPNKLPVYRFIISLGVVADMVWTSTGYIQQNEAVKFNPVQITTAWLSALQVFPATAFELQLRDDTVFDDSCTLVLAIGIEFGSGGRNGVVKGVKYAGCAKVLGMG